MVTCPVVALHLTSVVVTLLFVVSFVAFGLLWSGFYTLSLRAMEDLSPKRKKLMLLTIAFFSFGCYNLYTLYQLVKLLRDCF